MIGVIGGYGDVGAQASRFLLEWGKRPLRIGGRSLEAAKAGLGDLFPQAEWRRADLEDTRSLESFMDGCELIINCTGPSWRSSARVAELALSRGCHLVDAGMDPGFERLRGGYRHTAVLYGAGATPGLSGLLPRWLARSFDSVQTMSYYSGALGRFTASAAEDYLAGATGKDNEALTAWRDGGRRPAALSRKPGTTLPFFAREVTLYPYFDGEAEFVADALSLRDGEWHIAIDGERVPLVLEEVSAQFLTDRDSAVKRLCTATELDSAGRQPYFNMLVQLEGLVRGENITRTSVLRAESPAALTGAVVAAAGMVLAEGAIGPGVRPLAEIPEPDAVMKALSRMPAVCDLKVLEQSVNELLQNVEGEL